MHGCAGSHIAERPDWTTRYAEAARHRLIPKCLVQMWKASPEAAINLASRLPAFLIACIDGAAASNLSQSRIRIGIASGQDTACDEDSSLVGLGLWRSSMGMFPQGRSEQRTSGLRRNRIGTAAAKRRRVSESVTMAPRLPCRICLPRCPNIGCCQDISTVPVIQYVS